MLLAPLYVHSPSVLFITQPLPPALIPPAPLSLGRADPYPNLTEPVSARLSFSPLPIDLLDYGSSARPRALQSQVTPIWAILRSYRGNATYGTLRAERVSGGKSE